MSLRRRPDGADGIRVDQPTDLSERAPGQNEIIGACIRRLLGIGPSDARSSKRQPRPPRSSGLPLQHRVPMIGTMAGLLLLVSRTSGPLASALFRLREPTKHFSSWTSSTVEASCEGFSTTGVAFVAFLGGSLRCGRCTCLGAGGRQLSSRSSSPSPRSSNPAWFHVKPASSVF